MTLEVNISKIQFPITLEMLFLNIAVLIAPLNKSTQCCLFRHQCLFNRSDKPRESRLSGFYLLARKLEYLNGIMPQPWRIELRLIGVYTTIRTNTTVTPLHANGV